MKKIIYIDMDGVLVDFISEAERIFKLKPELKSVYEYRPDNLHGIFRNPKPLNDAIEAVVRLHESGKYELFIATSAPWENPESASDKRHWIETYFGKIFHRRMFITHRKDLLIGDYLIDDRLGNGASEFKGELIPFGWSYEREEWNEYPTWESVLKKLL